METPDYPGNSTYPLYRTLAFQGRQASASQHGESTSQHGFDIPNTYLFVFLLTRG